MACCGAVSFGDLHPPTHCDPRFLLYFSVRFYITLSGQQLIGREATRAAEEDKKAVKEGLGPAAKDRSMIMGWVERPKPRCPGFCST